MRRFFATLDATLCAVGRWLVQPLGTRFAVVSLLLIHAGLLAYSATRHSPTHLEPAFLASGISHWKFGRFELYRVNPPFPRMIAALPALVIGCENNWSRFRDSPGSRAEFQVGEDFVRANGARSVSLTFYARWACIPFSLVGGFFAFRWAHEMYGNGAGLLTLFLWTFEPNLLAHAQLTTPDCACWSFGVLAAYGFWRWLMRPTWGRAVLAGLALGVAELTKLSWLILFPLWPVLWLGSLFLRRTVSQHGCSAGLEPKRSPPSGISHCPVVYGSRKASLVQLAVILTLAVYVLNLGYAFDGSLTSLKDFPFVSAALTKHSPPSHAVNRFADTPLQNLHLPFPKQYIIGLDSQIRDLEDYIEPSFLRGEWSNHGWWYYYLYGFAVKLPAGLCILLVVAAITSMTAQCQLRSSGEFVLLATGLCLFVAVSAGTEVNQHLRYAFPSLAFALIFCGRISTILLSPSALPRIVIVACLVAMSASSMLVYPRTLAYFNEFVGGPAQGWRHLSGSSVDWGQDLLLIAEEEKKRQCSFYARRASAPVEPILQSCREYVGIKTFYPCGGTLVSASVPFFAVAIQRKSSARIGFTHVLTTD